MVGSGGNLTLNIVERILNTSDQKDLTISHSHQIFTCVPRAEQPRKQWEGYCGENLDVLAGTKYHL